MKKQHYALMTRVSDTNPEVKATKNAIAIATAQRKLGPYAHDWVRQDGILQCSKCGAVHFDKVFDGRIQNTCKVDSDAFVN